MPLMGMTMEEGAVTEWLVEEGAEVAKGDEVLEFETDKISARVAAPAAGILGGIAAGPGDLVKVQGLLAWILEPGETPPAEDPNPPAAAAAARRRPLRRRQPPRHSPFVVSRPEVSRRAESNHPRQWPRRRRSLLRRSQWPRRPVAVSRHRRWPSVWPGRWASISRA